MYIYSLVLLSMYLLKCISVLENSGVVNGSVLFAKSTFCFFFRKLNFEVNFEGYECCILMKDFI